MQEQNLERQQPQSLPKDSPYIDESIHVRSPAGENKLSRDLGRGVAAKLQATASHSGAKAAMAELIASGPCDLHIHSSASDGLEVPSQILHRVVQAELKGFALADHDSMRGVRDVTVILSKLMTIQDNLPSLVPAVELSTQEEGQEIHLLAYFPNGGARCLDDFLLAQQQSRAERNKAICERLQAMGYNTPYADLLAVGDGVIGRPHIAMLLVQRGYLPDVPSAFEQLLGEGKPAYLPRQLAELEPTIELVHQGGGVAVLAHPANYGWCGEEGDKLAKRIKRYMDHGLEGIEVVHGDATARQMHELSALGKELGLLRTIGSDYHGRKKHGRRIFTKADDYRALLCD